MSDLNAESLEAAIVKLRKNVDDRGRALTVPMARICWPQAWDRMCDGGSLTPEEEERLMQKRRDLLKRIDDER